MDRGRKQDLDNKSKELFCEGNLGCPQLPHPSISILTKHKSGELRADIVRHQLFLLKTRLVK